MKFHNLRTKLVLLVGGWYIRCNSSAQKNNFDLALFPTRLTGAYRELSSKLLFKRALLARKDSTNLPRNWAYAGDSILGEDGDVA